MKKKIIRISVLLVIISIFLTGCGNKKSITAEEFKNKMEKEEKYVIGDATEQFKDYNQIKKVYIVADKKYKYQLEFYEISTADEAVSFYNNNKDIFEKEKTGASAYNEVNVANYNKYTLKTSDKYKVLSRIDNTVVYVNADKKYKDDFNIILKTIGY